MFAGLVAILTSKPVVAALVAVGGWLYSKARGEKTQSIKDLAKGYARQAVDQLLDTPGVQDTASSFIESKIIDGLAAKLGVDSSTLATYEPIIHPIVEHAVADLMDKVRQRTDAAEQIKRNLTHITELTKNWASDFEAARQRGLAAGRAIFNETAEVDQEAPAAPATSTP